MPVDNLLSSILQRSPDPDTEGAVLHECRHCGSKFDEPVVRCPVCDSAEIATYEFAPAEAGDDPDA